MCGKSRACLFSELRKICEKKTLSSFIPHIWTLSSGLYGNSNPLEPIQTFFTHGLWLALRYKPKTCSVSSRQFSFCFFYRSCRSRPVPKPKPSHRTNSSDWLLLVEQYWIAFLLWQYVTYFQKQLCLWYRILGRIQVWSYLPFSSYVAAISTQILAL